MIATERKWAVYTLSDPRFPDAVRYVGVTHRNPKKRLKAHVYDARSGKANTHTANWIRSVLRDAVRPVLRVIENGEGTGWDNSEMYWIAWHKEQGFDLTNHTDGGEGSLGFRHSSETRAKLRADKLGKKLSLEHRSKISAAGMGRKTSPETRAKLSAVKLGNNPSPEVRAKISAAHLGAKHSPETRAKMSAAHKGTKRSHDVRAKMSDAIKKSWESRERVFSLEARTKMSEAQKARWEKTMRKNLEGSDG